MNQPTSTRTLLTMTLAIPAYWTPDQALAVVELLDDLRELIWAHYGMQLIDEVREQNMPKCGGGAKTPNDTAF
jgi:hypothetical protein